MRTTSDITQHVFEGDIKRLDRLGEFGSLEDQFSVSETIKHQHLFHELPAN